MAAKLSDALDTVTDGTWDARSVRDRVDGYSQAWELALLWAVASALALWQATGDHLDTLALSGSGLVAGKWWTLFSYSISAPATSNWVLSWAFLLGVYPASHRTSVREGLRQGALILGFLFASGLVAAIAYLAVDWQRAAPLVGMASPAAGVLGYRLARGRKDIWLTRAVRERMAARTMERSWRARLGNGLHSALMVFLLAQNTLIVRPERQWPALRHVIMSLGGVTVTMLLLVFVATALGTLWPMVMVCVYLLFVLLYAGANLSSIIAWLQNSESPWEALLAAIVFGATLGLLFPTLLPRPRTLETA